MSEYLERRIEIEAPIERVWQILIDFPSFPEWNPFIVAVAGNTQPGTRLGISVILPGRRHRKLQATVLAVLPRKQLRWLERFVFPGLIDGEHGFQLQTAGSARTLFSQHERFSGLLLPLVWRRLEEGIIERFDAMNLALKQRAETH